MMTADPHRERHRRKSLAALAALLAGAAVLAAVAVVGRPRQPATDGSADVPPDDCVRQMLLAAQRGDVETWLDSFAGDLRDRLGARVQERSPGHFAAELRGRESALNGIAIEDRRLATPDEAMLTLEKVYTDYNERYRVRLMRSDGGWRIVEMTPLDRASPEIPYGTPVVPVPKQSSGEPPAGHEKSH